MSRWTRACAYATGGLPWVDGMLLEDYLDAVSFKFGGVPKPSKWVDELRERAALASFNSLM